MEKGGVACCSLPVCHGFLTLFRHRGSQAVFETKVILRGGLILPGGLILQVREAPASLLRMICHEKFVFSWSS